MKRKNLAIIDDMALARLSQAQDDTGIEPPHSERILVLRAYLRMSQTELAKRAGLHQPQITDIKGGMRRRLKRLHGPMVHMFSERLERPEGRIDLQDNISFNAERR